MIVKLMDRFFNLLMNLGINRAYYGRIKAVLTIVDCMDETSVSRKAQRIMVSAYLKSLAFAAIYYVFLKDALFTGLIFFISLKTLLSRIVNTKAVQIELKQGYERLDSSFKTSGENIERALSETVLGIGKHVRRNFEEIESITAAPTQSAARRLESFSKSTHWIMGLLARTCVYVKQHGDRKDHDGKNVFQKIVRKLQREINSDYLSSEHVRTRTSGMGIFILSPLVLIPLYENAVVGIAADMGMTDTLIYGFYDDIKGHAVRTLLLVISVLFYNMYLEIYASSDLFISHEDALDFLLDRPLIRKLVHRVTPEKNSRKYLQIRRSIIHSGTQRTVGMHRLRKFLFALLGLVVSVSIVENGVVSRNYKLLHDIGYGASSATYERNVTGIKLMYSEEEIREMAKLEALVIRELTSVTDPALEKAKELMQQFKLPIQNEETAVRLIEKAMRYGVSLRDVFLLLIMGVLFTLSGYLIPDVSLGYRQIIYGERLMYEETMRLRTLVLVLKEQYNMTTEKVLREMEAAAHIFKDELIEINTQYGGEKGKAAVDQAIFNISYYPFQDMLRRLLLSYNDLSIQEAFSDLDLSMDFDEDERRDKQKAIAEHQVDQINTFAGIGTLLAAGCYMILPILIAGSQKMAELYQSQAGL